MTDNKRPERQRELASASKTEEQHQHTGRVTPTDNKEKRLL